MKRKKIMLTVGIIIICIAIFIFALYPKGFFSKFFYHVQDPSSDPCWAFGLDTC